jgi:hypothetical protein
MYSWNRDVKRERDREVESDREREIERERQRERETEDKTRDEEEPDEQLGWVQSASERVQRAEHHYSNNHPN